MRVDAITIETDEDGFTLVIEGRQRSFPDGEYEAVPLRFPIEDPEDLYNAVVGTIGEWLNERNAARATMPANFGATRAEAATPWTIRSTRRTTSA